MESLLLLPLSTGIPGVHLHAWQAEILETPDCTESVAPSFTIRCVCRDTLLCLICPFKSMPHIAKLRMSGADLGPSHCSQHQVQPPQQGPTRPSTWCDALSLAACHLRPQAGPSSLQVAFSALAIQSLDFPVKFLGMLYWQGPFRWL